MPNVRPFLDVVEVHHLVRPTESPQGIFPISVLANFRIPLDKVMDLWRNLVFQGVDNDTSD